MKKTRWRFFTWAMGMLLTVVSIGANASDHVDGESVIGNPVSDITDLFAFMSPQNPERLVVILNSYPFAPSNGHFSDQLVYSVRIKPIKKMGVGVDAAFDKASIEYRFDCRFDEVHASDNYDFQCTTSENNVIGGQVDVDNNPEKHGVRIFAGRRGDPFLFEAKWFEKIVFERCIPKTPAKNDLSNLNVLSLVLEFDVSKVFDTASGTLFAVAGEIRERNEPGVIFDRIGRPEISNGRLVASVSDDDLRRLYNSEKSFSVASENEQLFKTRIEKNLRYYDEIDGAIDWSVSLSKALVNILADDFLVIDVSKPFSRSAYFEIENSMMRSQKHTRSGGRTPGERVINTLMTTMVNGGHGPAIVDGIESGSIEQNPFPYLEDPHTGPWPFVKRFLAPRIVKALSLKKRGETFDCD